MVSEGKGKAFIYAVFAFKAVNSDNYAFLFDTANSADSRFFPVPGHI